MKLGNEDSPLSRFALLSDIGRMIDTEMNDCCEELKIQSGARRVLSCLGKGDGLSQLDIVRATRLKAPTISLIVQKMEHDGLITRKTDDMDMRMTRVYLTELGKNREKRIAECIAETEADALVGFSEEEKKTLSALLSRIYANLEDR